MSIKLQLLFRKIFIALTAIFLTLALAFTAACSNPNDDNDQDEDDSSTTTVTDYQVLTNGDFEFNTDKVTSFPYSSSINWSRSSDSNVSTADSSTYSSGIIDTTDETYDKLSDTSKPKTEGENSTFINPHTPYYYGLVKNDYDYEDTDKQINPNVAGNKILMINNYVSKNPGVGTAQKFKSSKTLTVATNEYAVVSVWVNTINLKSANLDKLDSKEFGAYVKLSNTVNSKSYDDLLIKNINTNGEWAKYSIYVKGSDLASTSLSVTVGLGFGNKLVTNEYVEGFAYFDNIEFKTLTAKEYETAKTISSINKTVTSYSASKQDFVCNTATYTYIDNQDKAEYNETSPKSFSNFAFEIDNANVNAVDTKLTNFTFKYNNEVVKNDYAETITNGTTVKSISYTSLSETEKSAVNGAFDNFTDVFSNTANILYFNFTKGASASFTSSERTLASGNYEKVTFYAKVKLNNSASTSAVVTVIDKNASEANKNKSLFSSISTEKVENDTNGWVKYTAFLYNPTDESANYSIKVSFGPEGESNLTQDPNFDLPIGYGLFADFTVSEIEEDVYLLASTSDYLVKQSLYSSYNSYEESTDETKNDSYEIDVDRSQIFEIAKKPTTNVSGFTYKTISESNVTHGLVNSKYINADNTYGKENVEIADIAELKSLQSGENNYAQAILLSNVNLTSSGYQTARSTMNANSYYVLNARIKALGNAKGFVYLTSPSDETAILDLSGKDNDIEWTQKLCAKAVSTSVTKNGWTDIKIYIATGNKSIDYKIEIWNGERDGSDKAQGTLLIEKASMSSSSESAFNSDKEKYEADFASISEFTKLKATRADSTVKYTDENGKEATKTRTYEPTEIYAGNDTIKFFSYLTVDADTEIDETTSSDNNDTETDTSEDETYKLNANVGLQITSIIIAIVLILVIVSLIVKTIIDKSKKKKVKYEEYYNRNTRDKAMAKISANKSVENDKEDYDYEAAEKIVEDNNEDIKEEIIDAEEIGKEDILENSEEVSENSDDDKKE